MLNDVCIHFTHHPVYQHFTPLYIPFPPLHTLKSLCLVPLPGNVNIYPISNYYTSTEFLNLFQFLFSLLKPLLQTPSLYFTFRVFTLIHKLFVVLPVIYFSSYTFYFSRSIKTGVFHLGTCTDTHKDRIEFTFNLRDVRKTFSYLY